MKVRSGFVAVLLLLSQSGIGPSVSAAAPPAVSAATVDIGPALMACKPDGPVADLARGKFEVTSFIAELVGPPTKQNFLRAADITRSDYNRFSAASLLAAKRTCLAGFSPDSSRSQCETMTRPIMNSEDKAADQRNAASFLTCVSSKLLADNAGVLNHAEGSDVPVRSIGSRVPLSQQRPSSPVVVAAGVSHSGEPSLPDGTRCMAIKRNAATEKPYGGTTFIRYDMTIDNRCSSPIIVTISTGLGAGIPFSIPGGGSHDWFCTDRLPVNKDCHGPRSYLVKWAH